MEVSRSSAERWITAPHVQVIHTRSSSTAELRSPHLGPFSGANWWLVV